MTHRRYIGSLSLQSKIKSHINNKDEKNTRSRCLYSFKHSNRSAQLTIPKEYLPKVHGTIRSKYELQTTTGMQRFQVRNARVSLDGKVLPVIAYKAEIDLSDEGSIKMLDAYARFVPNDTWNLTMGQMRVPFTIDAHRSPHQQYFANRSFIAKAGGECA